MALSSFKIAVIPGDGIGKEVVPEGIRVLKAAAERFDIAIKFDDFDFASCDYYAKHGKMMPDDWKAKIGGLRRNILRRGRLARHGARPHLPLGFAATVPPRVRPVCESAAGTADAGRALAAGRPQPWRHRFLSSCAKIPRANIPRSAARSISGTEREIVMQETVMSRVGVDRILRYAFDLANRRGKRHLTSATKSNGISITMPYWDERVEEMAKAYPDVRWDKYHIDILCAHFVLNPDRFDVVVASNLFGDILSDLGPACTGTIGIAPSGNINPEREIPVAVRAGARLGAGHCRQGNRQPDRPDLVRRDDARASRPSGGGRRHRLGDRDGARRPETAYRATSAAAPTPSAVARR